MKKLLTLLLIFFTLSAFAQVSEPAMLSLMCIGGNGSDEVLPHVTKTSDGGFIISYQTLSTNGPIVDLCSISKPDIIFQKYNADASALEWTKCYAANGFLSYIYPAYNGENVFGGGYNSGTGRGFYISKYDVLDNAIWSKGYSEGNSPLLFDMKQTSDGGYIMVGQVFYVDTNFTKHYGSWTDADIGILKLDSLGNKVWSKVVGGTGDDHVSSVVEGSGNSYYIVGTTPSNDSDLNGNHGGGDVYVIKLDKNGNILWHRDYGGTGVERATYAVTDGKGGVIVTASTTSTDGDVIHLAGPRQNIWALAVDSNNNIVWNNCYGGGPGDCYPNAICRATDGSIWIASVSYLKYGEIDTAYGNGDAWFVHADSIGDFINAKVLGSYQDDRGTMIYPLSNGNVIAGGFYSATGGTFPNIFYGADDAFLSIFAPWNQTVVKQVSTINNEMRIYPNPAINEVTIEISKRGNYDILITDVIGKTVYKTILTDKLKIPVIDWNKGLYYVQVISENGFKTTKKLLVE